MTIFAVLCLTVFAMLALTTVRADRRTADAAARAVTDYYAADTRAQEILALLRGGTVPEGVTKTGDTYSYSCPISDTQELRVEARVDGALYEIRRWQAVSTAEWKPDESLHLWDGSAAR
jgi:hypothetical protein